MGNIDDLIKFGIETILVFATLAGVATFLNSIKKPLANELMNQTSEAGEDMPSQNQSINDTLRSLHQ